MKLVKGRTLADAAGRATRPGDDLPRFLEVFEQVCQALAYAHARGVIHRDLKPANVMVGAFGEVQVMDWGLAKVLKENGAEAENPVPAAAPDADDGTARRARCWARRLTWRRSRPRAGRAAGRARSDVFGLGAILCEILTGKPPYIGDDKADVRSKSEATRPEGCDGPSGHLGSGCGFAEAHRESVRHRRRRAGQPRDAGGAMAAAVTAHQAAIDGACACAELAHRARSPARERKPRRRRQSGRTGGGGGGAQGGVRLTLALAAAVLVFVAAGWLTWDRYRDEAQCGRQGQLAGVARGGLGRRGTILQSSGPPGRGDQAWERRCRDQFKARRSAHV